MTKIRKRNPNQGIVSACKVEKEKQKKSCEICGSLISPLVHSFTFFLNSSARKNISSIIQEL